MKETGKKDSIPQKEAGPEEGRLFTDAELKEHDEKSWWRTWGLRALSLSLLLVTLLFTVLAWREGLFTDKEALQHFLDSAGGWAPWVFVLIQIIQCTIPIIPGSVALVIGVLFFGPFQGFIYNYLGILAGESLGFGIGRRFGKKIILSLLKPSVAESIEQSLIKHQGNVNRFFILSMILPGFPDDSICMVMGLTKMRFRHFFVSLLWTKPISILLYSLLTFQLVDKLSCLVPGSGGGN